MNHRHQRSGARRREDPLDTLTHELEAAYRSEATPSPLAIGVEGLHEGERTISRTELGPSHPADALIGLDAPAVWDAFGLLVSGSAFAEDSDVDRLDTHGPRTRRATIGRVRLAYFVDRHGHEVGLTRFEDSSDRDLCTNGPFEGRMVDACHRVLGLATAPPTSEPAELWAVIWLCNVVDAARRTGPPDWPDVARLHPAMAAPGAGAADLVEVGTAFGRAWTWERLRSSVAEGTIRFDALAPSAAAWMDDGMFARWSLHRLPVVAEMLEPLEQALPLEQVFTILDVLDAWELI